MRVLQFGLGEEESNTHHPRRVEEDICYYTSTHDAPPVRAWMEGLSPSERDALAEFIGGETAWDAIAAAWSSPAVFAGAQLQDLLELGASDRMNTPGTRSDNWDWAMPEAALTGPWIQRLRTLNRATGRGR